MFYIPPVPTAPILTVAKVEAAETQAIAPASLSSKEDFVAYIDREAPKYGLKASEVERVIDCETGHTWNPSIQSGYYKNGVREDSWGLAQINRPNQKGISYTQTRDPKFSMDYLMSHWHKDHWSCMH